MDKALILLAILMGSVLVVENLVVRFPAYILHWTSTAAALSMLSIFIGSLLGYGLRGLITNKKTETYEDDF